MFDAVAIEVASALTDSQTIRTFIESSSGSAVGLSKKETWALQQKWREAYSRSAKRRTGKWRLGAHDWHVFSAELSACAYGPRAFEYYREVSLNDCFVLSGSDSFESVRASLPQPTDFSSLYLDLYIVPVSWEWTMVFTHGPSVYGPYFSRPEWQENLDC